ncbi:MAG: protease inhibitor I42 family protein [Chloroflexi bacterium]|nr:protease inhibitor I42 family protein [Chloroflexota bacterium]
MKKILTSLIFAILLSACAVTGATEAPTTAPQFEISDPAKILEAAAGSEFKIIIDSNPTTGYHWEIVDELDANVVEFVSKDFKGSEPVMPGSGGVDVWTFKALSAGKTHITLGYYPPSNDPVEPQQTVTFTVTVK